MYDQDPDRIHPKQAPCQCKQRRTDTLLGHGLGQVLHRLRLARAGGTLGCAPEMQLKRPKKLRAGSKCRFRHPSRMCIAWNKDKKNIID